MKPIVANPAEKAVGFAANVASNQPSETSITRARFRRDVPQAPRELRGYLETLSSWNTLNRAEEGQALQLMREFDQQQPTLGWTQRCRTFAGPVIARREGMGLD